VQGGNGRCPPEWKMEGKSEDGASAVSSTNIVFIGKMVRPE
jgi:hypothetical protein